MKLPKGWRAVQLRELVEQPVSGVSVQVTDGMPRDNEPGVLRLSAIAGGRFNPGDLKKPVSSEVSRLSAFAEADTILISRSNTPDLVGASAYVEKTHPHAFLPDTLWLLRRQRSDLSMKWLSLVMHSLPLKAALKGIAHGTSNSMKKIQKGSLLKLEVLAPPFLEQQRVAEILGIWIEALERFGLLIAAKDRWKQALMQRLLYGPPNRRNASWRLVSLREVAEECSERNVKRFGRDRLFAVTKAEGMIPMRERVQGATVSRCKVVERGWFAYNPMRLNIGSIARWEGEEPVLVSGDYVVFRAKEDLLLSDYLNHIRRSTAWADFVGASGNGSVRVRIWFDDVGRFKLRLPPLAQQRAIADILDAADAELRLLRKQRDAIEQQKRGLMQKLLTGKIRVIV